MDQGRGSIHREKNLFTEIHILTWYVACDSTSACRSHSRVILIQQLIELKLFAQSGSNASILNMVFITIVWQKILSLGGYFINLFSN